MRGRGNLDRSQTDLYRMDRVANRIYIGWISWQRRGLWDCYGGKGNLHRGQADLYMMDRVAKQTYIMQIRFAKQHPYRTELR